MQIILFQILFKHIKNIYFIGWDMDGTAITEVEKSKKSQQIQEDLQYKWRISVTDFQIAAKKKLDKSSYGYFSAGADDEITLQNNRQAFKRIKLFPRVLVDMSHVCMKTKILGREVNIPFGVAPIAMQKLIHSDGEILAAKQAFLQDTAYGLSMLSTTAPSKVHQVNPTGLKIHQLYLLKEGDYTERFVKMVAQNGFHALALTVDTQTFGKRRVDQINKFAPTVSLQVFKELGVQIYFDSPKDPNKSFIRSINTRITWEDVKKLKQLANKYSLKLILKGINEEKDVELAHNAGVDALWISNHGGRQLDTSPAGIQALPFIRKQVTRLKSKMEVYVDGGVLKGSDIFKCLALGADFVFIGRGFLYSLIDGQSGIHKSFQILKNELKTTMMLSGTRTVPQINQNYVIYEQPYSKL